eukprot:TRINITY_DN24711_c0_g1_i1.p1 TRINITY_DN24711_c0_g1~~TRINITY_DN24711_c0_g1_i1.p1  ORF type:complete len:305 (-),score=65.01 TRINITY_DN24711_c0_g1_i1:9-923(-)
MASSAQTLLQDSQALLSTAKSSYKNIEDIRKCIVSIKDSKVIVPTLEKLEQVMAAYEWQNKTLTFFNTSDISSIKYATIEILSSQDINNICKEAEKVSASLVGPARDLYRKLQHVRWQQKVRARLSTTSKLTEREVADLANEVYTLELRPDDPLCGSLVKQILDSYSTYNSIVGKYETLMKVDMDAMGEDELIELLECVKRLRQNVMHLDVSCSELTMKFEKMEEYVRAYLLFFRVKSARETSGVYNEIYIKTLKNCIELSEGQQKSAMLESICSQIERYELSLIHICRCRRYAVCRSRWSPYH